MRFLLIVLLLSFCKHSQAQSIERDSYFSTAGNFAITAAFQLQSNIGELMTARYSSAQGILNQGFLQPAVPIPTLIDHRKSVHISVFPNPFSDRVYLRIPTEFIDLQIRVFDLQGRELLLNEGLSSLSGLDLSWLSDGFYLIRCTSFSKNYSETFKVTKSASR